MGTVIGKEGDGAVVADRDVLVPHPLTGINHKVFAGQPVPGDLIEAYQELPKDAPKAKRAHAEGPEVPANEADAEDGDGDEPKTSRAKK